MPLNKGGREALADFQKRYGEKKGKKYFYAAVNSGKVKNVDTHDCGCGGSCCSTKKPLLDTWSEAARRAAEATRKAHAHTGNQKSHPTHPLPDSHTQGHAVYDVPDERHGSLEAKVSRKPDGSYYGHNNEFDFSAPDAETMRSKLKKWNARHQGWSSKDEEPRKKKHRRHLRAHEVHGIINGIFFPIYQRCHPAETGTQDPTSVQPAGASTATGAAPPAGA